MFLPDFIFHLHYKTVGSKGKKVFMLTNERIFNKEGEYLLIIEGNVIISLVIYLYLTKSKYHERNNKVLDALYFIYEVTFLINF